MSAVKTILVFDKSQVSCPARLCNFCLSSRKPLEDEILGYVDKIERLLMLKRAQTFILWMVRLDDFLNPILVGLVWFRAKTILQIQGKQQVSAKKYPFVFYVSLLNKIKLLLFNIFFFDNNLFDRNRVELSAKQLGLGPLPGK